MLIFWRQGYHATNLPDLLKAMGLTRGSFYKAFGDKRNAYLEALKRYNQVKISSAVALLEDTVGIPGGERIHELFEMVFKDQGADRKGCLVCNAMVELAPTDADVAQIAATMTQRLQNAFQTALSDDGQKSDATLQRAIAVTNMYFGAQAISKTGREIPDWRACLNDLVCAGQNDVT